MADEFGFYDPSESKTQTSNDNYGFVPVGGESPKAPSQMDLIFSVLSGDAFGLTPGMPRTPIQMAAKALPIMAQDIKQGVSGFAKKIPGYISEAPSEIGGLLKLITTDPSRAGKVGLGGLAEFGHGILNTPHDLVKYGEHLGLLAPGTSEYIPKQHDITPEINEFLGNRQEPGEALLRGSLRNLPLTAGGIGIAGKIATAPLKLTAKNVVKDVLKGEKLMKEKYSGPNGLYPTLFNEARQRGMGNVQVPTAIDFATIEKYSPDKKILGVKKFQAENTIENAQKAMSDLGHITRGLENKTSLTEAEKAHYKAAKDAQDLIQQNMFKDAQGQIHQDLLDKHKLIQQGYANEVIPYTTHPAIKAYKRNELSAKELLNRIKKGKFAAKRGEAHPNIQRREKAQEVLGKFGKFGTLPTVYGAYKLIDYLLSNKEGQ